MSFKKVHKLEARLIYKIQNKRDKTQLLWKRGYKFLKCYKQPDASKFGNVD